MSFPGFAPPPFILATPGRPPLPWEQMFNVYLVASGAAEFTAERRKAILLHCLGGGGAAYFSDLTCTVDRPEHRYCQAPQHSPLRTGISLPLLTNTTLRSWHYGTTFRRRATLSSSVIVFTAAVNAQASPFMTLLPPYGSYNHTVRSFLKMMLCGIHLLPA
ncbi:hypothetical protein MTO96_007044 [Rhipicephalus appendiculatus]